MSVTLADYFEELEPTNVKPPVPKPKSRTLAQKHRPETDILLWLGGNAPVNFQNLADLRYCLYHRCSRADFTVGQGRLQAHRAKQLITHCEQQGSAFPFVAASNIGWRAGMAWGFASKWRCAYQAVALWLVGILIGSALTARCLPLPAKRTIRNSPLK